MPFLSNDEIAQRKASGARMNKLNCGWNIPNESLMQILEFIRTFEPQTETQKRDKRILEYAFVQNMNATQISRLNDPLLVGHGNRSKGKPLSPSWIWKTCVTYFPQAQKRTIETTGKKQKRIALYKERQRSEIVKPNVCSCCGSKKNLELHHIIPLAAGGTNEYFNLINLCHNCHMELHHRIYDKVKFSFSDNIE